VHGALPKRSGDKDNTDGAIPACSLDWPPCIGQRAHLHAAAELPAPQGRGRTGLQPGTQCRMNGWEMSGRAKTIATTQFAAALMGCTMLAGLPGAALAQEDTPLPQIPVEQPPAAPAPAPSEQVIRSIAVAGAQRLEPATIVSYIQLRVGQVWTAEAADQALRDLAATELFDDQRTRIDFNNGNVVITVAENPVINRIVLEGNRRIKDDKILPEIRLAPRQIFTRSKVRADVSRILELYKRQGRFAATVEPQMVQLDQNRVDVVFEINEGPKSK